MGIGQLSWRHKSWCLYVREIIVQNCFRSDLFLFEKYDICIEEEINESYLLK